MSDLAWPDADHAMVLVDKSWTGQPSEQGDQDVVTLLTLCPAKVPKKGMDGVEFAHKKRAASWKSIALKYVSKRMI
ncbi:hypothetical protein [Pseudomonas sp. KNUC1026]|uniref:hypothetical protein n=1 Tax=Pseudomonas sp. KNUC1026 TaxID=2893890 RepID=UPI001F28DE1F|nr:hypothetical protein [Pseudomonas sp. KNUC1026]UFH49094.1 hypothetical protein LN139_19585 [Pseudomonas sp. KNUC1026]